MDLNLKRIVYFSRSIFTCFLEYISSHENMYYFVRRLKTVPIPLNPAPILILFLHSSKVSKRYICPIITSNET